jgi:hypothetical protein
VRGLVVGPIPRLLLQRGPRPGGGFTARWTGSAGRAGIDGGSMTWVLKTAVAPHATIDVWKSSASRLVSARTFGPMFTVT